MSIFVMISMMCEKIQQSGGNMIIPMCQGLTGAIINIILDPLMIFGIGPFPEMGIRGAALATVIGQIFGMALGLWGVFRQQKVLNVNMREFKWRGQTIKDIYRVGLPGIVMQSVVSVMTAGMNGILIAFSQTAVNVLGVYFKLQTFLYLPASGIVQGMRPILSFNYGAGEKKRMKQILSVCTGLIFGILMVGTALFLLLPEPIMGMFSKDGVTIREGAAALRIISLGFVVSGISVVASGALEALGEGIPSFIISLLRYLVLIVPVASIGSRIFGITGVWGAFPVAEVLTAAVSAGIFTARYRACLKRL